MKNKSLTSLLINSLETFSNVSIHRGTGKNGAHIVWLITMILIILLNSSCSPMVTATIFPVETFTQTPTQTPTQTFVWFPPTATPTPFPTPVITPTEDYHPGLEEVILMDDFSTGNAWILGRSSSGSIALGKKELTIAITSEKTYLYTVREDPILDDFYLEITSNPTLCRGEDEYGVLIRFVSPENFYRFSLSCDGRTRLDKVINGKASSPQPWLSIGAIPPGAPSISRLAIWAKGEEMRFFINDTLLFSVTDSMIKDSESPLAKGKIGLFARSRSEIALTVNFSDLMVWQIAE